MDDFAHHFFLDPSGPAPARQPPNSCPPFHPYHQQNNHQPQHQREHAHAHAHSSAWLPNRLEALEQESAMQQQQQQQQQSRPHGLPYQQPPQQPHAHPAYMSSQEEHNAKPHISSRPSSNHSNQSINLHTNNFNGFDYNMLPTSWQYHIPQPAQQPQFTNQPDANAFNMNAYNASSFGAQLHTSPVDFMPSTSADTYPMSTGIDTANFITMAGPMESMNAFYTNTEYDMSSFSMALNQAALQQHNAASIHSSIPGSSPTGTILEVASLSDNEGSWSMVNFNPQRASLDSFGTVSNPSQNLHIRTNSDSSTSDGPSSAELSSSWEEVPSWPLHSPHDLHGEDYLHAQYAAYQHSHGISCHGHQHTSPASSSAVSPQGGPASYHGSSSSSSTSPTSSGPVSPPLRRRKSPLEGKTTKAVIKKTPHSNRKDAIAEKKVGRRRGPLRPDQRQQAHEIRKLRACLRCKFLKKTCDKGEPCGGCRPSHARLWQVPCTRMDIKDIGYFMKDWKADYERHVSLGFSVGNIKGFSAVERTLYVTHGYGHYLPIEAREVFVRDDQCFGMDWVETTRSEDPEEFEIATAKLSAGMEGVSTAKLSEYLDRHLDMGFENFVDEYFEGTKFLTEILKTVYRYYQKEKTPCIRKALKLVLAYNLTLHVTMVEGLSEEESWTGRIGDDKSKFFGKTMAPVMINFQVKCALADMWRELQKDILEELSSLYSSVYSGEKLKNWPTIFMLATILLAIWEEMQFDCHYRVPDEAAVQKFCDDMETTPVGVIVGLFQAISTKLPGLQEWDTKKHHQLLGSNIAVCDALTEVRGHVNKYEKYLKERQSARFDRDDFDCLSNKFLSKLVIRAN